MAEKTTLFTTGQVQVQALGLARQQTGAWYLSAVGPRAALDSLQVTLRRSSPQVRAYGWSWEAFSFPDGPAPQRWLQPLPGSNWSHAVWLAGDPALFLLCDPTLDPAAEPPARAAALAAQEPAVARRFLAALRRVTAVPLLDHWARPLWQAAALAPRAENSEGRLVRALLPLACHGDCLGAWRIEPSYPWRELVQRLVRDNTLPFDPPLEVPHGASSYTSLS